jgi:1-acyl-sn-glycerol-3-phosphate acyltransferase
MSQWLFPVLNLGFKTTLKLFSDFKIEGQENIPDSGPLLVASNHLSNLDPAIVAAALPRSPVFLAKKELFKYRWGSMLMRLWSVSGGSTTCRSSRIELDNSPVANREKGRNSLS